MAKNLKTQPEKVEDFLTSHVWRPARTNTEVISEDKGEQQRWLLPPIPESNLTDLFELAKCLEVEFCT